MKKKIVMLISLIFLFIPTKVYSENKDETGSGADFGINIIYPKNQKNGESGYFDLQVKPKEKQVLKIKVSNYSEQENKISIKRQRSTTSDTGTISYKEFKKDKIKSNEPDFNDIVSLKQNEVVLKPNESKVIEVNVALPEEVFNGEILGGIHFFKNSALEEWEKKKTVVNRFSYSVPIIMREKEKKEKNNLSLNKVEASHRNYHNFIEATLVNNSPIRVKKLEIDGSIFKKGQKKAIYTRKENEYKMAPLSTLNFGFDLNDSKIIAGEYDVFLIVKADEQEYQFKDTFTIEETDAKKLNSESVYVEEDNMNLFILVLVFGFFLFLIGIFAYYYKKKNQKQKNRNRKNKQKKRKTK